MPPKVKITRERILDAAFALVRAQGSENLNARAIARQLGCSTQPVLYHFATVEAVKQAVYQKADDYHSQYLMRAIQQADDPMLEIGMRYVRFAVEEQALFKFLFQSDHFARADLRQLIDGEELQPVLEVLHQTAGIGQAQAKELFTTVFLLVHGMASMLANNTMQYDEAALRRQLQLVFQGVLAELRGKEADA